MSRSEVDTTSITRRFSCDSTAYHTPEWMILSWVGFDPDVGSQDPALRNVCHDECYGYQTKVGVVWCADYTEEGPVLTPWSSIRCVQFLPNEGVDNG